MFDVRVSRTKTLTAVTMLSCAGLILGAGFQPSAADDLDQVVTANEGIVPLGTPHDMNSGHADLGPMILDGQAQLMVRDDADSPPAWWHLDDVVFTVGDNARNSRPDSDDYAFTGADPGQDMWLIPQTQIPDVPWLGWNTQSPTLFEAGARGMRLTLEAHEGPGDLSLFVQSGGFDAPTVLMSTHDGIDEEDSVWAEMNTHVHANWVFTEPGVHLVRLGVTLDGTDQPTFSQTVRFTVGPDAGSPELIDAARSADEPEANATSQEHSSFLPWIWALSGALVLLILLGIPDRKSVV